MKERRNTVLSTVLEIECRKLNTVLKKMRKEVSTWFILEDIKTCLVVRAPWRKTLKVMP